MTKDDRHPMHGIEANNFRLKSRNGFLKKTKCLTTTKEQERVMFNGQTKLETKDGSPAKRYHQGIN